MSHQPFPKKRTNLIKNTGSLKDRRVTCSPRASQRGAERSASRVRRARNPNVPGPAGYLGSNADAPGLEPRLAAGAQRLPEGTKKGTKRGMRAAWQVERGKVNAGSRKREEKADLGHGNKPRADTGSRGFLQRLSWLQTQREDPSNRRALGCAEPTPVAGAHAAPAGLPSAPNTLHRAKFWQ